MDLRVHRWRHELAVPHDWEAGRRQAAASELQALTHEIAALLAEALARALDDDTVLLLPSLCIDARFDLRADRHAACAHWARQLALQVLRSLDDPAAGAVRFPSRAHHAAAYLLARTRGTAAGSWWWRGFDGLAALPLAQALRTLLAESALQGLAVLAALAEPEAVTVLVALGEAEGWRVLLDWCEQLEASGTAGPAEAWPDLVPSLARAAPAVHAPAAAALLALRRQAIAAAFPPPGAADVARAAAAGLLVAAQVDGSTVASDALEPPTSAARALLQRLGATARRELARAVRQELRPAAAPVAPAASDEPLVTAFGGAAWLLYALHDLLSEAPRWPWPPALPGPGAGLLALLTIAAAMPPSLALAAWRDAAWRRVLDVPAALDLAGASAALEQSVEAAEGATRAWSGWLARTAREACRLRLPPPEGGPALDWPVDRASGLWLTGEVAAALLAAAPPSFRGRLAMTRAARAEARFLAANEVTQRLPFAWQPLVLWFAHAALRRLAVRVPGMAWASAAHLHANVLGVRGTLLPGAGTEEPWLLQLEPPPLDVLLAMTGLARARWPVQPGRWLVLARAEGAGR
jgi:hypothetical protein